MAKFFRMYAENTVEEYAYPSADIMELNTKSACVNSEFQFLDKTPAEYELDDESGFEFADFISKYDIPLISGKFRRLLDRLRVDNLFYKQVSLVCAELGRSEKYYLAIPPRIYCLDRERSKLAVEVDPKECEWPEMPCWRAEKIVVAESRVGNYKMFKVGEVIDSDIIVTEDIKEAVEAEGLKNVYFDELEEM